MNLPTPGTRVLNNFIVAVEEGRVKIPNFQRELVWSLEKSAELIDSMLKGIPIGTLILWYTQEELRCIRDIGRIKLPPPTKGEKVNYILDGQQRITSLYAAFKGEIIKQNGKALDYRRIYIQLDEQIDEEELVITKIEDDTKQYISIHDLVEQDLKKWNKYDESYHDLLKEYRHRIVSYTLSIIEVENAPLDLATDIFTRINITGKPLNVFEIMTAKTYDSTRDFDLALKTKELLNELNERGYGTIPNIVVLQIVSAILCKEVSKKSILSLKKIEVIDVWDEATNAIRHGVDFLKQIVKVPVSGLLPFPAILVPIAYFFYQSKRKQPPVLIRQLEHLFWRVSITSHYSYASNTKIAQDIRIVERIIRNQKPEYNYNFIPTTQHLMDNGEFKTSSSFIKSVLCLLCSKSPRRFDIDTAFVKLDNDFLKKANSKNYHHFFSHGEFDKLYGFKNINHVCNIVLIDAGTNINIGKDRPSKYLEKFAKSSDIQRVLRSHLIDYERDGVQEDNYELFLKKRAGRIVKGLLKKLELPEGTKTT